MLNKILHFLKDLPDKYILILVLVIMLGVAIRFGAIEPREVWLLVRDVTIAIISIAGYKRMTAAQEFNAPVIQTPAINNEQMNDAVINTESVGNKKDAENG